MIIVLKSIQLKNAISVPDKKLPVLQSETGEILFVSEDGSTVFNTEEDPTVFKKENT